MRLIIGHRGAGKTSWLKVIQEAFRKKGLQALCLDLDREVERASGQTAAEIFSSKGEAAWRKWERAVFKKLAAGLAHKKSPVFIALGAGFRFSPGFKPEGSVIWLRRPTDSSGRVFFGRPRLQPEKAPLKEHQDLYKKRELYCQSRADEVFIRREGSAGLELSDSLFLGLEAFQAKGGRKAGRKTGAAPGKSLFPSVKSRPFSLRLNPEDLPKNPGLWREFLQKRLDWGIQLFELNDESADGAFAQKIRGILPDRRLLFSSQKSRRRLSALPRGKNPGKKPGKTLWSWDLSLGEPPKGASVLALHKRAAGRLGPSLGKLSAYKNHHLKLAVKIFNLRELKAAYDWQREDPQNRSFLPRSSDGRWRWFRAAFGPRMGLHFIRERETAAAADQPFFSEALHFAKALRQRQKAGSAKGPPALAAVIGHPIEFSATPAEHDDFFRRQRGIPVLSVPIKERGLTKESLGILRDLGFVFFAVTSPLKRRAFLFADRAGESARRMEAANTLILQRGKWLAFNTDIEGFSPLRELNSRGPGRLSAAVWGGGGVRLVLRWLLPAAGFYSARTGKPLQESGRFKHPGIMRQQPESPKKSAGQSARAGSLTLEPPPDTLIWAVGRKRMDEGCLWPPRHWAPRRIIDLNYSEDSPGREYALKAKGEYQSGWGFFKRQAAGQRELFARFYKP